MFEYDNLSPMYGVPLMCMYKYDNPLSILKYDIFTSGVCGPRDVRDAAVRPEAAGGAGLERRNSHEGRRHLPVAWCWAEGEAAL